MSKFCTVSASVTGYTRVAGGSEGNLLDALYTNGPIRWDMPLLVVVIMIAVQGSQAYELRSWYIECTSSHVGYVLWVVISSEAAYSN